MTKNIIVVDDDPTNVSLIKILLELDGFSVIPAMDLEQANKGTDENTNAFIVDCNLARGANGVDLLRDVRAGNTFAPNDTIVIITSGDHRREEEAYGASADLFLLKPYPPDRLTQELNKLLSGNE